MGLMIQFAVSVIYSSGRRGYRPDERRGMAPPAKVIKALVEEDVAQWDLASINEQHEVQRGDKRRKRAKPLTADQIKKSPTSCRNNRSENHNRP